jgi:hypothetical protein
MSVEAYVFISTTDLAPQEACKEIRKLHGVVGADALKGSRKVFAIVEGQDESAMEAVVSSIRELPTVANAEPLIRRRHSRTIASRARS